MRFIIGTILIILAICKWYLIVKVAIMLINANFELIFIYCAVYFIVDLQYKGLEKWMDNVD